jgi:hypothetical protein
MGLGVSVFWLAEAIASGDAGWDKSARKTFKDINAALKKNKIPPHNEPETVPADRKRRSYVGSFGYDYLRHLRRLFENCKRNQRDPKRYPVIPRRTDAEIGEAEGWIADTLEFDFDSNLLCHSIYDGYYIPLPTDNHILGDKMPGGFLGSSSGLLAELRLMAPFLDIKLKGDTLTDAVHARVWKECHSTTDPWMFEKTAWLTLFETASASIKHTTAIVFH